MADGKEKIVGLPIFINGYRIVEEENIFELVNVNEIEYIPSTRSNVFGTGSQDGVALITMRTPIFQLKDRKSEGLVYTPLGISSAHKKQNFSIMLPQYPGEYFLTIELLCGNKQSSRILRPFTIMSIE